MAKVVSMTEEYSASISRWKYDGIYSFYDHNEENTHVNMDGKHFACLDDGGELTGYFCFGEDARVPIVEESAYEEGYLDMGLGLRPDLCGKGLGLSFMNAGLKFAREFYKADEFRLSVAAFNERAVKVYIKAGFYVAREVTNSCFGNKFLIMKCSFCDRGGR